MKKTKKKFVTGSRVVNSKKVNIYIYIIYNIMT